MAQSYVPPSEIDGSPVEVERASVEQIQELYEEVTVQIRNTFMTRRLDAEASLSPEALAKEWETSDRNAECHRIRVLLARL